MVPLLGALPSAPTHRRYTTGRDLPHAPIAEETARMTDFPIARICAGAFPGPGVRTNVRSRRKETWRGWLGRRF
jgi:hypothetical protein